MPEAFDPGTPLDNYRQHSAGSEFHCNNFAQMALPDLKAVISDLIARQLGGKHPGISQVARTFGRKCSRCGAVTRDTLPYLPPLRHSTVKGGA